MPAPSHHHFRTAASVVGGLLLLLAGTPAAWAKKIQLAPCDHRFLIVTATPLLTGKADNETFEAVELNGKQVTFGGCSARAKLRATKTGWKVTAKWRSCRGLTKPRLTGTIDASCNRFFGVLKAKHATAMMIVAPVSRCGDNRVDPQSEQCDPPDGASCTDKCQLGDLPPLTTTTTAAAVTSTTMAPGATTTTTTAATSTTHEVTTSTTSTTSTTLPGSGSCGDGVRDPDEECDGADLNGVKCPDGSASGAYVACGDDCRFDFSHCPACASGSFASTWDAIQKTILTRHDCANEVCHGNFVQGGLDLRPGVAYHNLFEVASTGSIFRRIEPGDQRRSYFWLKLAAGTDPSQIPDGVTVGSPMPQVGAPLTKDELEALRLWIYAGAPETGTITGTETKLGACLPPAKPLVIEPLPPPAPDEGLQFVMPDWPLEKHSEHENCFATYYDFSDQVPEAFKDPSTKTQFRFEAQQLRQDPQSHHLILYLFVPYNPNADLAALASDPGFGGWSCVGGEQAGNTCDPLDRSSCGTGICTSQVRNSFACVGYGPAGQGQTVAVGGAQKAQDFIRYPDGVFGQFPMKGFVFWNSHAFNLTDEDSVMHARINYNFAQSQVTPLQPIFNVSSIFSANAAPYTKQTICNTQTLPRYARLFNLSSHTHKRGERFWITAPGNLTIYENFVYNDPPQKLFAPPLAFDSSVTTQRRLQFCATYNNGVASDGSPDPEKVTRRSRVPPQAYTGQCRAVGCVAGNLAASCASASPAGNDRLCDSYPGANDGKCDACNITGGESTENEMFILIGSYFVQQPTALTQARSLLEDPLMEMTRSTFSELAIAPPVSCGSAYMNMDILPTVGCPLHGGK